MKHILNPFIIGRYAGAEYFCDRDIEADHLYHNIKNGRNVALISDRRLGKTGLILLLQVKSLLKNIILRQQVAYKLP